MRKLTKPFSLSLLAEYVRRASFGPYRTKGDAGQPNSPAEWEALEIRADRLVANPTAAGNSGVAGEQIWIGYTGTVIDPANGTAQYPLYHGTDLVAAAFRYVVKGRKADADAVRESLLYQVRFESADGYIGASVYDWPVPLSTSSGVRPNSKSGAREASWIKRLAQSYLYCRSVFSMEEQAEVEAYLEAWVTYFALEMHSSYVAYTPFRLTGDFSIRLSFASDAGYSPGPGEHPIYPAPDLSIPRLQVYEGRTTIPLYIRADGTDGPLVTRMDGFYGNPEADKAGAIAWVAAVTGSALLASHAKAWVRDWFFYSVRPDGTYGEYVRNGDYGNPAQGAMSYGTIVVQNVLEITHVMALCGDDELRYLEMTAGVHGTQVPEGGFPKSLRLVLARYLKNLTGEDPIFYALVDEHHRISGHPWNLMHDEPHTYITWFGGVFGISFLLYGDAVYRDASQGLVSGMEEIPANGWESAGKIAMFFNGIGAEWPAMFFLFAGLPDLDAYELPPEVPSPFEELKEYFRTLATRHKRINGSFIHGDARRFSAESRSALQYPCFWLETPQQNVKRAEGGNTHVTSSSAFIILWNAPSASASRQDEIWAATSSIAYQFIAHMIKDAKGRVGNLLAADAFSVDPIDSLFVDNDFGWRVEFQLKKPLDICIDPNDWNDGSPA